MELLKYFNKIDLNIAGLFSDIIGVTAIFFIKQKGLSKLRRIRSSSRITGKSDDVISKINQLVNDVNGIIDANEKMMIRNDRIANWFFALIFIGFLLQLISQFI